MFNPSIAWVFIPSSGWAALVIVGYLLVFMPIIGLVLLIIGSITKSTSLLTVAKYLLYIAAVGFVFSAIYFLIYIYSIA
jgi:hypothetical protein